jgi:hypothetical protein
VLWEAHPSPPPVNCQWKDFWSTIVSSDDSPFSYSKSLEQAYRGLALQNCKETPALVLS